MYRLVLYGLILLSHIAIVFGFLGLLPFDGIQLIASLVLITVVVYAAKYAFSLFVKAPTNSESSMITAFILFLVVAPVASIQDVYISAAIAAVAVASKYVLAIDKKHIFNPVAIAVFLAGLFGFGNGIWWVGSLVLLPFVAILGLLIVRKIRRFQMFWVFLFTAVLTMILFNLRHGMSPLDSFVQIFASWPIVFFGTVMLTEPLTAPPRKKEYMLYGGLVGVLFGSQFHIGPLFASPELALVIGNIYAYIVSPKYRLLLTLKEKVQIAPSIYEFIFAKNTAFKFIPGQYLEWTLPEKSADGRGNRRYFTIASSPTEQEVRLGVKIATERSSKFKQTLVTMKNGDSIVAGQLAGDFVLPEDVNKKLVFIAGGIGVTPFRSMLQYLLTNREKRDIVLFYACSNAEEFVYKDVFAKAQSELGITVVYVISHEDDVPQGWTGEVGHITEAMIKKYVQDVGERTFYLSGPNAMVDAYKGLLKSMGVRRNNIIKDFFSGF